MTDDLRLALGIDTGGTYTDAVLLDINKRAVVAADKALTTYRDLMIGVNEAIAALPPFDPRTVELVSLSTTLATNAIVEGRGRPIALFLIGYDPGLMGGHGFMSALPTEDVVFIVGGHDTEGNERQPLDEAALLRAVAERRNKVTAFAVSGYFSVRNPAHELRAKELIEQVSGLPVTCGHELSHQLNAVRRATTVALNARLIPLLRELILAVKETLARRNITAPLMLVKGDGSLLSAEAALQRPVETILSGPAASAIGARYLSGLDNLIAVDMGGTTTDIAVLEEGQPRLNPEGARVGHWQTMVEAVDMRTAGLGGDSYVCQDRERGLQIGPQRVIPLAMLAAEYPQIVEVLARQAKAERLSRDAGLFLCARATIPENSEGILGLLREGPVAMESLLSRSSYPYETRSQIETLEAAGWTMYSAFTPTDALHASGTFARWSVEAARLGATILARRAECSLEEVCRRVTDGVSERAAREIVGKIVGDALGDTPWPGGEVAEYFLSHALNHHEANPLLDFHMQVKSPLVAIGAPVEAYFPSVANRLHSELAIPRFAEVANAVGAVAGSIVQRVNMLILPLPEGGYRLHGPDSVADFEILREAAAEASALGEKIARQRALEAGGEEIRVRTSRQDKLGTAAAGWTDKIYLGTEILVTAVGRVKAK
jgi:N-methylhydantoinase A/oxoprolinase/acetone carboxylase beta subunit